MHLLSKPPFARRIYMFRVGLSLTIVLALMVVTCGAAPSTYRLASATFEHLDSSTAGWLNRPRPRSPRRRAALRAGACPAFEPVGAARSDLSTGNSAHASLLRASVAAGARPAFEPVGFRLAEVQLYGDVVLRYVSYPDDEGLPFLPGSRT
jgi:hypothetical protein